MVEDKINKELNRRGGMVSSADFRKYLVRKDVPKMKELFRDRDWKQINEALDHERGFIIEPFNPLNLMPFSYDLSIGDEAFSCRLESRGSFALKDEKNAYKMEPGETVIVKTLEYIALPRCYSATIWPRFNFVREGIFQSMVKIDPTWYGKLGIALTNLSPTEYPIWKSREFATLVLYELTSDTDITLYRSGEILDGRKKIKVSLDDVEIEELESKIKEKGLEGKCTIENSNLIIGIALSREEFGNLMEIDPSGKWKKLVEKAMRMKTMGALGLPELDLILEKDPKGERLEREQIATSTCTQQALIDVAVERGKPFNLIAAIPEFIIDKMRHEITPRIQAEVEANIFPKIITLTLTVLGFLSLVIAVAAFVMEKYRPSSPAFLNIEWSLTATVVVVILGAVLLWAIYRVTRPKTDESRALRRLQKKVEVLEKDKRSASAKDD
jgi:deoxycytidine triphosphate deaminase